ncbi:MAG: hypothetical protein JNL32_15265 [Candidatus Kapabacteria bacterium]|nr:hypothetical protein [Candidatus Kapabacteria bacterium]
MADKVPVLISQLADSDAEVRNKIYWQLDNTIVIQSDPSEAAFYAVELLVELIENNPDENCIEAYELLEQICIGSGYRIRESSTQCVIDGQLQYLSVAIANEFYRLEDRIRKLKPNHSDNLHRLEYIVEHLDSQFEC